MFYLHPHFNRTTQRGKKCLVQLKLPEVRDFSLAFPSSAHLCAYYTATHKHNTLLLLPSGWQLTRLIVVMPLILFCSWGLGLYLQGHCTHKCPGALQQLFLPLHITDALWSSHKAAIWDDSFTGPHPFYSKRKYFVHLQTEGIKTISVIHNSSRNWLRISVVMISLCKACQKLHRNCPDVVLKLS